MYRRHCSVEVILWGIILLISPLSLFARSLNENAEISLLTATPIKGQLESLYGHTALRVNDPEANIDYAFNYGVFGESLSGFETIVRAFTGTLRSEMWVLPFKDFLANTQTENRTLREHKLYLQPDEKNIIWQKLLHQAKKENRQYTFDLFRENCTTFPRDLVMLRLGEKVILPDYLGQVTHREINDRYINPYPWIQLFEDIVFGQKTNEKPSPFDGLYIPLELERAWLSTYIKEADGSKRPLIASSILLIEGVSEKDYRETLFTPLLCSLSLLVILIILSILEWRKKVYFKWVDGILFGITGLIGIVYYIFKIGDASWHAFGDWMILWIHPLHLVAAIFIIAKPRSKFLNIYHITNLLLLGFLMAGVFFLPQYYNQAFVPFMASLWLRSCMSLREREGYPPLGGKTTFP